MMDTCCTPSSRPLAELKLPRLKNKNKHKHKTRVSRSMTSKESSAGRAAAKVRSRAAGEAAGWSLWMNLPLGPAAGARPRWSEGQVQDDKTRPPWNRSQLQRLKESCEANKQWVCFRLKAPRVLVIVRTFFLNQTLCVLASNLMSEPC